MLGKPVVLVNVILVPDPPVPFASFNKAPFKVVVNDPKILPPHNDIPQPKAPICSAGPT